MSHAGLATPLAWNLVVLLTNGLAWAQGMNWGAAVTGLTVIGGIIIGFAGKWFTARAAGILEVEKARAEAEAYKRRLEMTVEAEWERQNATSLKQQIAVLQQQSATLQATLNANTRITEELKDEVRRFREREKQAITSVTIEQAHHTEQIAEVRAATVENAAKIGETQAGIERLGGGASGEGTGAED